MAFRRWMTVITEEQRDWLKETSEEASIKAKDVLQAAITKAMEDKSFRSGLSDAKLRLELQALQDKRAELAEKEAELKRKIKGDKVTA